MTTEHPSPEGAQDEAPALERAAEILRDYARSLRIVHTSSRAPGDWAGEDEAKAAHDEYLAVADALEREHARVQELERAVPQWVPVAERLPEPGTPVLLDIGKRFPIRAVWAAKHTIEPGIDQTWDDWCDYDEAADTYYCPEGWYEWNEHEECHWSVSATPRAWMALPEQDRARGAQGDSNG